MNPRATTESFRRRLLERHGAATIRALTGNPRVEYRRQQLWLQDRGQSLQVPHLRYDLLNSPVARCRGVTDAMAMRLLFSDRAQHKDTVPKDSVAAMMFDILEQLRTESLVPNHLAGLKQNIDHAFHLWCRESRGNGLTENEIGLLIYGITHIVRARLMQTGPDEEVEGVIETVRFRLAPLIGTDLSMLRAARHSQMDYARYALAIAGVIAKIAHSMGIDEKPDHIAALRSKVLLLPTPEQDNDYDALDFDSSLLSRGADSPDHGYTVFCREFDRQVKGSDLYRLAQRCEFRKRLDKLVVAQAVNVPRLALSMQRLFAVPGRSGWHEGEEEGYLDGRRLSQLVARPGYTRVFKQERRVPRCDAVVSFLLDNSGSMKRQRYETVAVLIDTWCRALDLAGVKTEVLGFTTGGWSGGESIRSWRRQGSPPDPGRLADRLHIVYKDADTSWRQARYSISAMMNPLHFREGLDGEALDWASKRLLGRTESRKCLLMLSDGAPMESATINNNDHNYLVRHLINVAKGVEDRTSLELAALGVAEDMTEFISRSMVLDLSGTLDNPAWYVLESLFSPEDIRPRAYQANPHLPFKGLQNLTRYQSEVLQ